jgi:hemolysin activation/secretion protein
MNFKITGRSCLPAIVVSLAVFFWLSVHCGNALAAEPVAASSGVTGMQTNVTPGYNVQAYVVQGKPLLASNLLASLFSKYTGTNVSLREIVHAASDLETEYRHEGYVFMNIVIAPKRIANGIVTLDAFPGAVAQIVVAGRRYLVSSNGVELATSRTNTPGGPPHPAVAASAPTNQVPVFQQLRRPATPEEMARAYAALAREMADISAQEQDTRIHVVSTNAGPRFTVENYQIDGNSILSPATMAMILTNIDGAYGTNVSLDGIRAVASALQSAYRARGFVTVDVALPPQKLTNATVKIQVIEGRLMAIDVKGNYYYSSDNVMRALPSLHTNMLLNGRIFEAELDRANANQNRQISPVIEPGPDPGTSELVLNVQDRLPLHAKVDLDNQNSPGTPDLRLNVSAVYDNLWQHENSLGFQYGFSPEEYKLGKQWNFYDVPSVANYSTFYRLPLGNPASIADVVASSPGSFGYNEATRKFDLPPPSGQPDLTFFASRSTIDTGLTYGPNKNIFTSRNTNFDGSMTTNSTLNLTANHQDLTINDDLGFRLNLPLRPVSSFHSGFSGGIDFKSYGITSSKTNFYTLNTTIVDTIDKPIRTNTITSIDIATLPETANQLYYLPLTVRYDGGWQDALGAASFGVGLSANLWDSASSQQTAYGSYISTNRATGIVTTNSTLVTSVHGEKAFRTIAGSGKAAEHWVVLNPSFSHDFQIVTNWVTTIRADGQWSSAPLISNEQFGSGGVNSVRGYHEGEVFGDTGWHVSLEQQTPAYLVGMVYGRTPLTVRGTIYMDFANTYLLDPQGRPSHTALWGTGIGGVASIGSHWQARLLMSIPLLDSPTINAYEPYFNFMLTGQF